MSWCFTIITVFVLNVPLYHSINTECVDGLLQWITANGGQISDLIEIRSAVRGRGVYTTSNALKSNDTIASIPISLLFTTDDASKLLRNILPREQKDAFSSLNEVDTLSLALLIESSNADSFWNPYFECLPSITELKHDISMPLWWSSSEINLYFQTSVLSSFLHRRLSAVHDSLIAINATLHNIGYLRTMINLTLDHWIWAQSIVYSRQFEVYIMDRNESIKCLMPFGDLFNMNQQLDYTKSANVRNNNASLNSLLQYDIVYSSSSDKCVFKVKEDASLYLFGAQLFVQYTVELAPNFLIIPDYGFCIKNNPMDGVWITIEEIAKSLSFKRQFRNKKIKMKAQNMMQQIIESLQLTQTFVVRSITSQYYMDYIIENGAVEPYGYSLFLMSLVLNSKNDILLFAQDLLNIRNIKLLYPKIKNNRDVIALIVSKLNQKYKSHKKTKKLIKNTWNTVNNYIKKQMGNYDTSLIQDIMIREQMDSQTHMDTKLDCGLYIRTNEKFILLNLWIHLQTLRKLLLSLLDKAQHN